MVAIREKAKNLSDKVKDVSDFLVDNLNVPPTGQLEIRVTYADSCHLRHAQKVITQPRDLLKSIPGLELAEIKTPDRCCGSAGVYNIVHSDTANKILDMKMAEIAATGARAAEPTDAGSS